MEKGFLARLPSEGRLERDAPVGVLVDQNGARRKIFPRQGVPIAVVAYVRLRDDCNATGV